MPFINNEYYYSDMDNKSKKIKEDDKPYLFESYIEYYKELKMNKKFKCKCGGSFKFNNYRQHTKSHRHTIYSNNHQNLKNLSDFILYKE
jgi:hypothetical protein